MSVIKDETPLGRPEARGERIVRLLDELRTPSVSRAGRDQSGFGARNDSRERIDHFSQTPPRAALASGTKIAGLGGSINMRAITSLNGT